MWWGRDCKKPWPTQEHMESKQGWKSYPLCLCSRLLFHPSVNSDLPDSQVRYLTAYAEGAGTLSLGPSEQVPKSQNNPNSHTPAGSWQEANVWRSKAWPICLPLETTQQAQQHRHTALHAGCREALCFWWCQASLSPYTSWKCRGSSSAAAETRSYPGCNSSSWSSFAWTLQLALFLFLFWPNSGKSSIIGGCCTWQRPSHDNISFNILALSSWFWKPWKSWSWPTPTPTPFSQGQPFSSYW